MAKQGMTKEQWQTLKTDLNSGDFDDLLEVQKYGSIADAYNHQERVPNPENPEQVPVPIQWHEFISLLKDAELEALYTVYGVFADHLERALNNNERALIVRYWAFLKTKLTPGTVTAIQAKVDEKRNDPSHPDTVLEDSRAMTLGLPNIKPDMIQSIDNGLV